MSADLGEHTGAAVVGHYEHGALLTNQIRILALLPGEYCDPIQIELSDESIDADDGQHAEAHYEALSYTWGAATPTREIKCHGQAFEVRLNLFHALKHLRFKAKVRRLWADAICIDQSNIPERNQHVQRMDKVFAGADRVLVWLGEESVETEGEKVLQALPLWLGSYPPHINWHATKIRWDTPSTFSFSREGLSQEAIDWLSFQQVHLLHLLHFFGRHWWHRRWILQEIVQAKEAILICGHEEVPWEDISGFFTAEQIKFSEWHDGLARMYDEYPDRELVDFATNGIFSSRQLARIAANFNGPDALTLWDIVYETNDFRCTEPRDHLFSLLAIAPDVLNAPSTDLLKVDYSAPIRKISSNYCCWLLKHNSYALVGFGTVTGNKGCGGESPSWTPNIIPTGWMQRPDLRRPLCMLSSNAGRLDLHPRPDWHLTTDDRILSIKGSITETVIKIEPPPYVDVTEYGWTHFGEAHALWIKKCYDHVVAQTTDPQQAMELIYLLLTCGGDETRGGDARDWQSPSVETCRRWLDVLFDQSSGDAPNVEADPDLSAMTRSFVYSKYRQFCMTSERRFGWIPMNSKVGDKICVLLGGKLPFTISDCGGGHYNLMGEAYINGIMGGQALESNLPVQMIEIC